MAEVIGNVEELAAIIRREAQQKALSEEADARTLAQKQLADAKLQVVEIKQTVMAQARQQAEEEAHRSQVQAELDARRHRLQAREALLDDVWQAAVERLRNLSTQPTYARVLEQLAISAARILGPGTISLAGDPIGHALLTTERLEAWRAELAQELPVTFNRASNPGETWGGLLATREGGRQQIDATFPTRLALAKETMRERVAALLEVA
jgi:vacuolar-type H+-ATPase subunit E/Vma4